MNARFKLFMPTPLLCALLLGLNADITVAAAAGKANIQEPVPKQPESIQWNQIGAKAGADYHGDGLAVTPAESGTRLHCVFQRLDGEATSEGLWLTSNVTNKMADRFQVKAAAVGRTSNNQHPTLNNQLANGGNVSVDGQTVRFSRAGLVEEYSVSMDGVRQDFVVMQCPAGAGELVVELAVTGAKVEPAIFGARLVLNSSGRKIAYSRLRVADATGRELPARIEVIGGATVPAAPQSTCASMLTVVVNAADAVYPVRIDPTFSDANWMSMGGMAGANGPVYATVVDGSGNLYIGGAFSAVGNAYAANIAEWNGRTWSALGSGVNNPVYALTASGSKIYAGGLFSNAGGNPAVGVAQWNGSQWSALYPSGFGSKPIGSVFALAVSGSTLYSGGLFSNPGYANSYIAQWNGTNWSQLGLGLNGTVSALAASGGNLYAGGNFTTAGGNAANYIAQWNGSNWSALGSGMNSSVLALAVSGNTVYAGGNFTNAGGGAANYIGQWNGSNWSAISSGMNNSVDALAVAGGALYAGGRFTSAGGNGAASHLAQWNGTNWLAVGSDMNNTVYALAASGSTLYVGGQFQVGSGSAANFVEQWNGTNWSALGPGMNYSVSALAVSGSTVYSRRRSPAYRKSMKRVPLLARERMLPMKDASVSHRDRQRPSGRYQRHANRGAPHRQ